jgi:hypothetical protein
VGPNIGQLSESEIIATATPYRGGDRDGAEAGMPVLPDPDAQRSAASILVPESDAAVFD